jgi:hypothetical protein
MIEALCMTRVGMPSARARKMMSVCVVALVWGTDQNAWVSDCREYSPKRIAHNKEGDVLLVRVAQDLVGLGFDHVAIRDRQLFSIESFLAIVKSSISRVNSWVGEYQALLLHEEDAGVRFEVDARASLDRLRTRDQFPGSS